METQLDFLNVEVEKNITLIKKKLQGNRDKTGSINILAVILSALITLTLGFDISAVEISAFDISTIGVSQKNIALVLGALLTIVNGWSLLFSYKKSWIRQKKTLLNLRQLQNKVGFLKSATDTQQEVIDNLFSDYLDIWEQDGAEWENIHTASKTDSMSMRRR